MTDERSTETHAAWGAGHPHLIVSSDEDRLNFSLDVDEVTIGSAADSVLKLPEIDALHATIVHDERDEYVLTLHGEGEMNANPHAAGTHPGERSETLRTGASFTAGPWRFVFQREEFADHGRPFGGRQGGEFSDQPPQRRRPDYTADPSGSERPDGVEVDEH
ncbi:MAG: FHA domain-containing protein [Microbacterium gubbeenense]